MDKALKYVAYALGSIALFAGSFFLFAALSGSDPSDLGVVGGMFAEEETEAVSGDRDMPLIADQLEADRRPSRQVVDEAASPLHAFMLEPPFSTSELESLESMLQMRMQALDERARRLAEREAEVGETEEHLEHLYTQLETLRTNLLEEERELSQGQDELDRDIQAQREREAAGYAKLANIFNDGKAADAAEMLVQIYAPKEAAKILVALSDDRVGEIMRHVPNVDPARASEYFAEYQKADGAAAGGK